MKQKKVLKAKNANLKQKVEQNQLQKNIKKEDDVLNLNGKQPQKKTKQKHNKIKKNKAKSVIQTNITNIKCIIPKGYPAELLVEIKNLPDKCKQIDIVESFNKYGAIAYMQKLSKQKIIIAFTKPEESESAIQANNRIRVCGKIVSVKKFVRKVRIDQSTANRTVFVFRLPSNSTVEQVQEYFESCGVISSIKLIKCKTHIYFSIIFEDEASALAALKLHNTLLNDRTMNVRLKSQQPIPWDMKRTIVLLNPERLSKLDGATVTKMFNKCGDIEKCDVLCDKNRLAIMCFKNEDSVQKALKLNNTIKQDIRIEIEMYALHIEKNSAPARQRDVETINLFKKYKKTKILIQHVTEQITEENIRHLFNTCGPVKSVKITDEREAIVEFKNSEGYATAFSLQNYTYGGGILKLEPFIDE